MRLSFQPKPYLGFGLGLRTEHYESLLSENHPIDWLEIITENYLVAGGKPLYYLDRIREKYPMVMHGVSLSVGSVDALDWDYLKQVKILAERIQPEWISDHLCWTGINKNNMHDLLPLPYTQEAIQHVVSRIQQVQDYLGRKILIENVSSYVTYSQSVMKEWEFLSEICERADCYILLDLNNVYVSALNHGFNSIAYLNAIPGERVYQFHLAGHSNHGDYAIDTHDQAIIQPVWDLYSQALQRFGQVSTMIERDDNIPSLSALISELNMCRRLSEAVFSEIAL